MIEFYLPTPLPSLNSRQRRHWAQLSREQERLGWEVLAAIGGSRYLPRPPYERARVEIVRRSSGQLDTDGLWGSTKPLLDVLCIASKRHPRSLGIITDDDPVHCELVVTQERCERGKGSTFVRITPLEAL
jgi:hypothetical protein